jgi:poly-gamma-glutamate synthesis protein (capsule biosynthesis protein)
VGGYFFAEMSEGIFMIAHSIDHPDAASFFQNSGKNWSLCAGGDFGLSSFVFNRAFSNRSFTDWLDESCFRFLSDGDFSFLNFEGVCAGESKPHSKIGPSVFLDDRCIDFVKYLGLDLVSLANNHSMDAGYVPLETTVSKLSTAGVCSVGVGLDADSSLKPKVLNKCGIKVVCFSATEHEFGTADIGVPGVAPISHPALAETIRTSSQENTAVVVFAHRGVENIPLPPIQRQTQLRALVDAGASVVIGHHPHVAQGWEFYRQGVIFYSLGNFLFLPGMKRTPANDWSYMVKVKFKDSSVSGFDLLPFALSRDFRLEAIPAGESRSNRLSYLQHLSDLLEDTQHFTALWRALSVHLWKNKYHDLINISAGKGLKNQLRPVLQPLVRKLRAKRAGLSDGAEMTYAQWQRLLLLSLFRTESHRWTIETSLECLSDKYPDFDTMKKIQSLLGDMF